MKERFTNEGLEYLLAQLYAEDPYKFSSIMIPSHSGDIDFESLATVAFSGNYSDLINLPTIPENLSDLNNDVNFLTEHQDISGKVDLNALQQEIENRLNGDNDLRASNDSNLGNILQLLARINALEERISQLNKSNIQEIEATNNLTLSNEEADYVLSGSINEKSTVKGKSVELNNMDLNAASMSITATEDVDLKNVTFEGTYNKQTQGNSMLNVQSNGYVTIKDCTLNANGYNGVEIGLSTGVAKNILIDNVNFEGHFSNNAISIYKTADNAVITISNCHFESVSNILRLSNTTGCKATINLINCVCDQWETGDYAGAIICQDYTSKSIQEVQENNLFKNLTINIQNLVKPDGTKLEKVEDLSTICGSGNEQIIYLYGDKGGLIPYDVNRFPTINIL